MKEVETHVYDDIHWLRDMEKVEADTNLKFPWEGKEYELDLTAVHYKQIAAWVEENVLVYCEGFVKAEPEAETGSPEATGEPDARTAPPEATGEPESLPVMRTKAGKVLSPPEVKRRLNQEFYAGLREWAANKGTPIGRGPYGQYDYPGHVLVNYEQETGKRLPCP